MLSRLQISALDLRLSIMAGVLVVMALVFHALTGNFLTPENLYNIAQQTAVVGIVAAAIALIIVARQIDLSVGSVLGVVGVLIAFLMYSKGWHWVPACLAGLAVSLLIALYQGWLVAYLGVPSFVVTLGGLMSFRGAAFLIADGKTQPVSDPVFLMLGGGLEGSLGPKLSWALGLALAAVLETKSLSRRRIAHAVGV
jgi:D-xylose transport system permease protein